MFLTYEKTNPKTMTRLPLLVAVLIVCLAWQCSAKEDKDNEDLAFTDEEKRSAKRFRLPKRRVKVFFESDVPGTLKMVDTAREKLKLAKSAENLAKRTGNLAKDAINSNSKDAVNATAEVLKSRDRANTAVKALEESKDKGDPFAKMAAEFAKELYDNDTAIPLLTEEHLKWFAERYGSATTEEAKMTTAIRALTNDDRNVLGMHPLVTAVLFPARNVYKRAQDAENDAKYVVRKRVFTEMLAERIESLSELAKTEKKSAETCTGESKGKGANANKVAQHRNAATKAYLSAASAQKIAASCVTRIKSYTKEVETTYYELRQLLAKIRSTDYQEMRVYQSIGDEAHADAEECEQIAAGTPDYAEAFVNTTKTHLDSITPCVDASEAEWRAKEAQKASKKALNEMQYALYQLFSVTVSLQQVADAKKTVADSDAFKNAEKEEKEFNENATKSAAEKKEPKPTEKAAETERHGETTKVTPKEGEVSTGTEDAKNGAKGTRKIIKEKTQEEKIKERTENNAAMREAKKKAVESEKEAETSYDTVRAHADKAADAVQYVANIVKQVKELAAQVTDEKDSEDKKKIQEQVVKAEAALQAANQSSNTAQTAAAAVYDNYNKTKSAADSALQGFEKTIVDYLQSNANTTAGATKTSQSTNAEKTKKALEAVEGKQKEAMTAYEEAKKLVEELGKKNGFQTLKMKGDNSAGRDSATPPSLLHVSVAVICVMVVSMLGAV